MYDDYIDLVLDFVQQVNNLCINIIIIFSKIKQGQGQINCHVIT